MRLLLRFATVSPTEWFLLLRALGALIGFRLALRIFSFPRLKTFLNGMSSRGVRDAKSLLLPAQIGRAVGRASRLVPGSTCLPKALAAQFLLRRADLTSQLHVGVVKRSSGEFLAHAWVECGGLTVVGGSGLERYTPILRWDSAAKAASCNDSE